MIDNFVAEAWTTLAIALLFIALRLYSRYSLFGFRNLALEDAFMILAGLWYTAETTAAYTIGAYWKGLANSGMTEAQRATIDPASEEYRLRVNGSKTHIFGWFTYTALVWSLKACWILYYARLTDGVDKMRIRIQIGYVLVPVTYLAAILVIFLKCYPLHKQWQITPDPGNNCQPGYSKLQVASIMAMNTATDLYIIAIPLPMIWKSRLPTGKKLTLLVLFSGGFIVIAFGILRCTTLLTLGAIDPSQSGKWSCRESFVAVVVSNLPMVYPLFQRWYARLRGDMTKNSSSRIASYPLDSHPQSGKPKRFKNFQHPLSIPNETGWGSDEAIVTAENGEAMQANGNKKENGRTNVQTKTGTHTTVSAGNGHADYGRQAHDREGLAPVDDGQITVVSEYSVNASQTEVGQPPQGHTHFTFHKKECGY